jgi:hypothetical protein
MSTSGATAAVEHPVQRKKKDNNKWPFVSLFFRR